MADLEGDIKTSQYIKKILIKSNINTAITIRAGKNSVLLNSVQGLIETQNWLPLTFSIYLHNKLSFIHSISNINKECRCLNKIFHQIDRKLMIAHFINFYGKIWVGFCLQTGKRFVLEVSFQSQ